MPLKASIIEKLRYASFAPLALIASIIAGVFGNWLGNYGIWVLEGNEFFGWVFSGAASAIAFMYIGMQVSPSKTNKIKWILLSVLFVLAAISSIGSFMAGDSLSYLAGITMIITGLIYKQMKPEEIV